MSIMSVLVCNGTSWMLVLIRFMNYIMTLMHTHWLPSSSNYWYSSSLILVSMVVSYLAKFLPVLFCIILRIWILASWLYLAFPYHTILDCGKFRWSDGGTNYKSSCSCFCSVHILIWEFTVPTCLVVAYVCVSSPWYCFFQCYFLNDIDFSFPSSS